MKRMGLGTFLLEESKAEELIREAYEQGYSLIDTAWLYNTENIVGKAVKKLRDEGKTIELQTKIWTEHFVHARNQFEQQQKTLGTKIDSILLHRPSINFNDAIAAWEQLVELKEEGRVNKIGVSNFDEEMINILIRETGVKPEVNQIELNIKNYRHDRVAACKRLGIEIEAWSPLGIDGISNPVVQRIAKERNISPGKVIMAYVGLDGIVPIPKTNTLSRVKENIDGLHVELTTEEINALRAENEYKNKFGTSFAEPTEGGLKQKIANKEDLGL